MNIELRQLDKNIKLFLISFLILLTLGVTIGMVYLYYTTNYSVSGTVNRFNGSEVNEESFEIPDSYPKPLSEMLVTTHNHLIAFALIFLSLGSIFYFNSTIKGFWKNKITRILLVVVFTNIGSSLGTFVAIPLMVRVFA